MFVTDPKKQVPTFSRVDINRLVSEAADEVYLLIKLDFSFWFLIIGICYACRGEELTKMTIDVWDK